jgi:hypothetical protein
VLFCSSRDEGAKRSGVATAGSDVSFIEQIGGACTGTLPDSGRAVIFRSPEFVFRSSAAWRLNVISRLLCLRGSHSSSDEYLHRPHSRCLQPDGLTVLLPADA